MPNSGRGLVRLGYRTEEWDGDFRQYLKDLDAKKPVILCGDMNVAHCEIGRYMFYRFLLFITTLTCSLCTWYGNLFDLYFTFDGKET